MGGRRTYSITEVFKKDPTTSIKRSELSRSLKEENPEGITRNSAKLIPEHRELAKIVIYSNKLLNEILTKYKPADTRVLEELRKRVRLDWAEKKRDENLETNRIIDIGVVDAVTRTLQKIKK